MEPIKTQVFRLDDIKPAPYNPRVELTAKDREFKALTASIEQHGLVQPLIVNIRDGYLIGGHQRLNVLKAAGETETEAVVVDLDEAHAKALCLALNKLDGEWDYGILYDIMNELRDAGADTLSTGFTDREIDDLIGEIGQEIDEEEDADIEANERKADDSDEIKCYGKITIIQGDPGEGKTTLVLQIIAALTTGRPIWDGLPETERIHVIYQTAEDGLSDTIKPRLVAAGADCARVLVIDDSEKVLTLDDDRLEQALEKTGARLVVLDPIQGYIGSGVDMHRANEIRPLMHRLAKLAEKYSCAVILIGHMNKNSGDKSSYRGLGSIDFQAAARSVLVVGRIKDDPTLRVVCPTKSSLAPEGKAVAFRLDPEQGFQWVGQYDISADELLSGSSRGHMKHCAPVAS